MVEQAHPQLFTIEKTAELLGLKPPTVRAWMARRKIGFVRLGRAVRIPAVEIERLILAGTVPAKVDR
jgi:excisionase family DNA binding protein